MVNLSVIGETEIQVNSRIFDLFLLNSEIDNKSSYNRNIKFINRKHKMVRKALSLSIISMLLASLASADAGSFYDDKYLYSDKDLIVLEQVFNAGKAAGETYTIENVVSTPQKVKDLSKGNSRKGFYSNSSDEEVNVANSASNPVAAENISKQVKAMAKVSSKIRKELLIPGDLDPMLLELDRFMNQPLIIEQSEPVNMLEIVATTIPQGWRVYFSNTKRSDFVDEYELFVPKLPRGAVFKKLEHAFGVTIRVMNQPESPYVIVSKNEEGSQNEL
jgi:hypothetical protein